MLEMMRWTWFAAGFGAGIAAGLLTAWLMWLPPWGRRTPSSGEEAAR